MWCASREGARRRVSGGSRHVLRDIHQRAAQGLEDVWDNDPLQSGTVKAVAGLKYSPPPRCLKSRLRETREVKWYWNS